MMYFKCTHTHIVRSIEDFATVLLEGDVQNWINRKKSSFPFLLTVAAFRSCFFYFVNCNHLPQYFRKNVCCGSQSRTSASLLVPLARQNFAQNRSTNCGAQNCNGPDFCSTLFCHYFLFWYGCPGRQANVRMLDWICQEVPYSIFGKECFHYLKSGVDKIRPSRMCPDAFTMFLVNSCVDN